MGIEKIRFLYLSISADQASSLPRRHSRTRRVSGHAARTFSRVAVFWTAFLRALATLAHIKLFQVPQRVRIQNRRPEISHTVFRANENVRTDETNHRQIFRNDFLHPVVELLALCEVER